MTSTTYTTVAALLAAVPKAKPGDTLTLAAGNYPEDLGFSNAKFAAPGITIEGAGASVAGMEVDGVAGVTLKGFDFKLNARIQAVANVTHCERVHIPGGKMRDVAHSTKPGLMFRWCADCSYDGVEFKDTGTAVRAIASSNVSLLNGNLHDLQGDGIQGSGDCHNITISGNHFTDFYPSPGDHPDAIQFFTTNSTLTQSDIIVKDNVIRRGKGAIVQGIFFGDENGLSYQRVTITGNGMAGTMYNGIAVSGKEIKVDHNFVQGFTDMNSWAYLNGVYGGSATNNTTSSLRVENCTDVVQSGNVHIANAAVGDYTALDAWLAGTAPPVPVPDPCAQCKTDLAAAQTQVASLTAQNKDLSEDNFALQTQVTDLNSQLAKLDSLNTKYCEAMISARDTLTAALTQ